MYREVQKICIRKIYTSENAYMYREVRNICITFEIYVSEKYIYQKPHICTVKFEIYVSGSENIYIRKSDTCKPAVTYSPR